MKKKIIIALVISTLAAAALSWSQSEGIRIAVSAFNDSITPETEQAKSGANLSSRLEREYQGAPQYQVRASGSLASYLENLKCVQLGLCDQLSMKGMSKALKVDYLVVGTVTRLDGRYNVDARVVNIDTWKIMKSHGVTSGSLDEALSEVSFTLVKHFTKDYLKDREDDAMQSPTVAVFGFRDENPAAMRTRFSSVFTEMLNSVLGQFRLINTVERTYTKTLIDEKVLEMVGVIENDSTRKNRDVMDIQYKLIGGFRVFSDVITLNYKLISMSTGRIVLLGSRDIGSSAALRPVCEALSIQVEDALHNRIGTLKLESEPAKAEVYIDGELAGKAPLVTSINKGSHSVSVKSEGYETQTFNLSVEPRAVVEKKVKLERVSRRLIEEALACERSGKYGDAVRCYDEFLSKYGDTVNAEEALYRKGHLELIYMKNPQGAIRTFEALAGRYPGADMRAEAYYGLVKASMAAGNRENAVRLKDFILQHYGSTTAADEVRAMNL